MRRHQDGRLNNAFCPSLSRRGAMFGAGALMLAGCKPSPNASTSASSGSGAASSAATLAAAIAGDWRTPQDKARDVWRHPLESLTFWGVKPGATVVEFWPGAGWYTDILAPFLAATGGTLYAAGLEPDTPAAREMVDAYRRKLAAKPALYGQVHITAFGPNSAAPAPAGTVDVALFLRNLHDWMAGGFAEKAFHDAYQALKPGGVLGVEQHRTPPGGPQDVLAADGYVQVAYVKQMAKEAGFDFDRDSEINANPKDDRNHPFGVWTLPPTRLSAPRGQPPDPKFDHGKYDAIGESDRMTLRFVKET
jgi:predicted methyltransferase